MVPYSYLYTTFNLQIGSPLYWSGKETPVIPATPTQTHPDHGISFTITTVRGKSATTLAPWRVSCNNNKYIHSVLLQFCFYLSTAASDSSAHFWETRRWTRCNSLSLSPRKRRQGIALCFSPSCCSPSCFSLAPHIILPHHTPPPTPPSPSTRMCVFLCMWDISGPWQVHWCIILFCQFSCVPSKLSRIFHCPCIVARSRILGLLGQEVACCVPYRRIGLLGGNLVAAVPIYNAAVQDGYWPTLMQGHLLQVSRSICGYQNQRRPSSIGAVPQYHVAEDNVGTWLPPYQATAVRGRCWPILIAMTIAVNIAWYIWLVVGRGLYWDQLRHCSNLGCWCYMNPMSSTVECTSI